MDVTRCWYAEHLPFPLNFFLPGQMQRHQLAKLRLQRGDESQEVGDELEKEVSARSLAKTAAGAELSPSPSGVISGEVMLRGALRRAPSASSFVSPALP